MAYVDLTKAYGKFNPQGGGFNFEENKRRREARLAQEQASQQTFPIEEPPATKQSFTERLRSLVNGAASVTGGNKIAQGLGQGLAMGSTKTTLDSIQAGEGEMQQKLIQAIRNNKAIGKDTSRLEASLKALTGGIEQTGAGAEDLYNPNKLTTKQVIGDALQLGTTVGTLGGIPGAAKNVVGAIGVKAGVIQGIKTGVKAGLGVGALSGTAQGLKQDKDALGIIKDTAVGALGGGITGGVLGGVVGGVSGGLRGRALNKAILKRQEGSGLRPTLTETVKERTKTDKTFSAMVKEAQKQGFNDAEINFLSTVSKQDKPTLKKMFDLTVKAQSDPRQITRAGDILGENVTNQVKQVVNLNKQAGSMVDETAKALRGKAVDVSPLKERILGKLNDLGIKLSPSGKADFNQSVFKNTPAVQKEIQKVISSVPDGSDAYQLHIFKKSIDELVDYGTTGEGLRGTSANLLKSFRNAADEVLDATFDDYNIANTGFKQTRDYIDAAKNLVGKKVDLNSREGAQAFGQALRSAFSNNKSRGNTLKFIEETHLISKQLGLSGKEKNLLDQAIYVNMLEETFGSEAATGLAGEVTKAINKAKTVAEVVRNPISGGMGVLADVIEKSRNITPEAKKQILKLFIK